MSKVRAWHYTSPKLRSFWAHMIEFLGTEVSNLIKLLDMSFDAYVFNSFYSPLSDCDIQLKTIGLTWDLWPCSFQIWQFSLWRLGWRESPSWTDICLQCMARWPALMNFVLTLSEIFDYYALQNVLLGGSCWEYLPDKVFDKVQQLKSVVWPRYLNPTFHPLTLSCSALMMLDEQFISALAGRKSCFDVCL